MSGKPSVEGTKAFRRALAAYSEAVTEARETREVDFIQDGELWKVFAKNSMFKLGTIEWVEGRKAYDFIPNSNAKFMKVTQDEGMRRELQGFCKEQTEARVETEGNK